MKKIISATMLTTIICLNSAIMGFATSQEIKYSLKPQTHVTKEKGQYTEYLAFITQTEIEQVFKSLGEKHKVSKNETPSKGINIIDKQDKKVLTFTDTQVTPKVSPYEWAMCALHDYSVHDGTPKGGWYVYPNIFSGKDRLYPARFIFERLGYKVTYEAKTKKVMVSN